MYNKFIFVKKTMASAKTFIIKETEMELKRLMKTSQPMISKRLHAMLVFKRNESFGIAKRVVAEEIGVNHNSVQTWRSLYISGGIKMLMSHSKIGYKPSIINKEQELALKKKLNDQHNRMVGFVELLDWFNKTFNTEINYKTFHGFVVRKFDAKIKVARKSHVKKDVQAADAFKKTLNKSAGKSSQKKRKASKK